ncbi:hypothetical protein JGH11_13380 [Dysgonomonas sp. Marseille-P4677]|uniref:hypothetical protein n=1 Tax=Dysgonomonas sp. Marseille-P4677 TaxID=2364790 RepID=UPI001913A3B0|nr:hypothetical protein [Dysgonomonas sp. Marseille-P4677]MBK5721866.1 hypothetical protein [Dysgonomonas sp. Marseille-P4677]
MAEKKLEVIIIDKGGDKLKDKLKDIKIEAVSAKEQIQKMAEEIPNVSSKVEEQLKNLSENGDKLKQQGEIAMKTIKRQYIATVDELFKSFYGANEGMTKRFAELASQSSKMAFTMEQIQGLNEKAYKTLEQTIAAKQTANQAEIEGLAKNAKSATQVIEAYEKRKQLIAEEAEIKKARITAEYEDAKKQGGDIVALEKLKAENVAMVDKELKESLKKNSKEYETAAKAFNDKLYNSFTENVEVYEKHVSRKTKKMVNEAAASAEKILGLSKGALNGIAKVAMEAETANQKAAEATKQTATEAGKTAEETKKIIDVDATRKKVDMSIEALKHYQAALRDNGRSVIEEYDKEIAAAADNIEKRKEIEAKKAEAVKYYGSELIKVSQSITAANKKEQDLDLIQWQQYMGKMQSMAESVKGTLTSIGDYFSTAFTSISNIYKAEIAGIDEELTQLKNENAGFTQDYANRAQEIAAIDAEISLRQKENANADISVLKEKRDVEQKIQDDSLTKKHEIEAKERELQAKKAKEQEKQEKIEKLKRKAELLKSIGEGIFNIAQGATKALSYGPILGPILAAVVAAAGAIQIGIMTKQLAKFADGGLLNGKRHSEGGMRIEGTNIEVEGGEYVVNRESTSKNLGLVRYINSQSKELTPTDINGFFSKASQGYEPPFRRMFEAGGQMPAISSPNTIDNDALVDAIKSIKIAPKVAVTDILRVQDEMVQVDSWSGN